MFSRNRPTMPRIKSTNKRVTKRVTTRVTTNVTKRIIKRATTKRPQSTRTTVQKKLIRRSLIRQNPKPLQRVKLQPMPLSKLMPIPKLRRKTIQKPLPPPPPPPLPPPSFVSRQNYIPPSMEINPWMWIGKRLDEPLCPKFEKKDIFNKTYRAYILDRYILKHTNTVPCPIQLQTMYAISIHSDRLDALKQRLGPWSEYLQHWPGTDGNCLDKQDLVQNEWAVSRLTRGQIGCYDSHAGLWMYMVENNIPAATILEDDADIQYGSNVAETIAKLFEELKNHEVEYDFIYLGHNNYKTPRRCIGTCIGIPNGVQGAFMYYVTLEGAKKLLENIVPITQPIDDYIFVQTHLKQVTLEPSLNWVVPVRSDTTHIV